MKQKLFAGLMALSLNWGWGAWGQPSDVWENWANVQIPPAIAPIDARTFVNHKGATFSYNGSALFNTYDTLNFTNQGVMYGNPGFDFLTVPATTGVASMAANFVNQANGTNGGIINCSGLYTFVLNPLLLAGNLSGNSKMQVWASNIVNSGTITMDASSLMKFSGKNVDLSRGSLDMVNPISFLGYYNAGILDGYWGIQMAPYPFYLFPPNLTRGISPVHPVTTRNGVQRYAQLVLTNFLTYVEDSGEINSNRTVQAVILANTNAAFANSVYFTPFEIGVQWQWQSTNWLNGVVTTNYLFLTDQFGGVTNLNSYINGYAGPKTTYIPFNYNFYFGAPYYYAGLIPPAQIVVPPVGLFGTSTVTNAFSAYEAIFTAGTQLPGDVAGGNVTNMAGRIEITADNTLNLNRARISSLNYLLLKTTNHFVGSQNAQVSAPNLDLYLRTTNGMLSLTNLVLPSLEHLDGLVDLWSGRWTNVVNGVTNTFHVLMVDSRLSPTMAPRIQTLNLSVTNCSGGPNNLVISDVLNVTSNLLLNVERITLTTNEPGSQTPVGRLNILNSGIQWSNVTPSLRYLTNWGAINSFNAYYFGGSRTQPPYSTNLVDRAYETFVNHGGITNQGSLIWAHYFENSGVFDVGLGSFQLQQTASALLTNGSILAVEGDVFVGAGSLFISNQVLRAGGALTLLATNLDDGTLASGSADGVTNRNFWSTGNGINLLNSPAQASLLGTTITNFAADYQEVANLWAGADLGGSPAGFSNNAAVGRLILDGGLDCLFRFSAVGAANALYVDCLELRNGAAANVDRYGNFLSVVCDPNMKVYFAQALANGRSIAEKLNQVNGGQFVWVSNYNAGSFSSTNLVYPDGSTNRLNTALATSCDIDSNGNGIPNCADAAPVPALSPAGVDLRVTFNSQPAPVAVVSWNAFPATTNVLMSTSSPGSTNWQVVTNFIFSGPMPKRVTVTDSMKSQGPRFYRVRVLKP